MKVSWFNVTCQFDMIKLSRSLALPNSLDNSFYMQQNLPPRRDNPRLQPKQRMGGDKGIPGCVWSGLIPMLSNIMYIFWIFLKGSIIDPKKKTTLVKCQSRKGGNLDPLSAEQPGWARKLGVKRRCLE